MTVSSETSKAGPFNGNGITVSFPFSFKVFATTDLVVVRTNPAGVETTLVNEIAYSISLNADQDTAPGGSIILPVPLATGDRLTISGSQIVSDSQTVGFKQAGVNAVSRSVQEKLRETVSVKDFGAVGDGKTDDTESIRAAYASLVSGRSLYFPVGVYRTTSKITFAGQKKPAFIGDGPDVSVLLYDGAVTNDDCFVIGNGTNQESGWYLVNLSFRTNVDTTAGAGVRFRRFVRSTLENVWFGDQTWVEEGGKRNHVAAWFDSCDMVSLSGYQARGIQEGIRVNGALSGPKADLFLNNGKIGGAVVGLHVAGAFGGLYVDSSDIIGNTTNVLIDQSQVAESNRETFFGPGALIDSGSSGGLLNGTNIYVNDTTGFLFLDGTWVASAGTLIRTGTNFTGVIHMDAGILFNAKTADGGPGYGIHVENAGAQISLNGTLLRAINGVGFICTAAGVATDIVLNGVQWLTNPPVKFSNVNTNLSTKQVVNSCMHAVLGRSLNGTETLFGTTLEGNPRAIWAMGPSGGSSLLAARFSNDANSGWIEIAKSRNATIGNHTLLRSGDVLGGVNFSGSDGSAFHSGARICAVVNGTPAAGDMPTALEFYSRAPGGALTARAQFQTDGTFRPAVDNTYSIGSSVFRWSVVYSATGTINTSDAREKENIKSSDLGLRFINSLHPVSYTWKVGKNMHETRVKPAVYGEDGELISEEVTEDCITPVPGTRTHYGLIAQEVKAALKSVCVDDFAGWVLDDSNNSDSRQGLRYDQFIAPIVKAIQELSFLVDSLSKEIDILKNHKG